MFSWLTWMASDMRVMSEGLGFLNFVRSISPDGSRLLIASFYESSPDILYVIDPE